MEDKAFCVLRPDDLPIIIKPIRLRQDKKCVLSGKTIKAGEYAYPAMKNPIRIWPYGSERASIADGMEHIQADMKNIGIVFRIPTFDEVMQRAEIAKQQKHYQKQLEQEATRLLKDASKKNAG